MKPFSLLKDASAGAGAMEVDYDVVQSAHKRKKTDTIGDQIDSSGKKKLICIYICYNS